MDIVPILLLIWSMLGSMAYMILNFENTIEYIKKDYKRYILYVLCGPLTWFGLISGKILNTFARWLIK